MYPKSQPLTITISFARDRFRTMINVLGDALAAGIMAHICRKEFIKDGDEVTTPGCVSVCRITAQNLRALSLPHLFHLVYKRCFRERIELGNVLLSQMKWRGLFPRGHAKRLSSSKLCLAHWGWELEKQLHCPANV